MSLSTITKYHGLPNYDHDTSKVFKTALSFSEYYSDAGLCGLSSNMINPFKGLSIKEIADEIYPNIQKEKNISEAMGLVKTIAMVTRIPSSKKFVFTDKLKEALSHTNTPKNIEGLRLPFKAITIDEWFIMEEHGVILMKRIYQDSNEEICGEFINMSDAKSWNSVRDFMPVLLNMLLYLTSEKPDIERSVRKEKVQKRKNTKRTHKCEVIIVGRNYTKILNEDEPSEKGSPLTVKFMVRGHWRNQHIKDGFKRIFIEPFWKGPDIAEVINKQYKVI